MTVPEQQSRNLQAIVGIVTYGWGMIPVHARIGRTAREASMWPKDGRYIVPVKSSVRLQIR